MFETMVVFVVNVVKITMREVWVLFLKELGDGDVVVVGGIQEFDHQHLVILVNCNVVLLGQEFCYCLVVQQEASNRTLQELGNRDVVLLEHLGDSGLVR